MIYPIDIYVGKKIRQHWRINKITQSQLANVIGIQFHNIQKYKTAMNRVSTSQLWHIAKTLDLSINYFFKDVQEENKPMKNSNHSNQNILDNKESMLLMRSYYSLLQMKRRKFLGLVPVLGNAV